MSHSRRVGSVGGLLGKSIAVEDTGSTRPSAVKVSELGRSLDGLSPEHRSAVVLAAKGVPNAIAAAQLSIPEGTFKSRVARGRMHLRALMDDPDAKPYRTPEARVMPAVKLRSWKGVSIG